MATQSPTQSPQSAFTFLSQGAAIQEFRLDDQNIVLGFPEAKFYRSHNSPYFGETIGRTTNRVKNARIYDLNGKTYLLYANDGPNCLHGGKEGWGKKDFEGPSQVTRNGKEGVQFTYVSRDGDEEFPGTVECKVWYTANKEDGKTVLDVEYQVEFVGRECAETVVGVTNHSYFNLNPGSSTIKGTLVNLSTDQYLALDSNSIPTGEIIGHPSAPAPNTTFALGATSPSFDDCMVINTDSSSIPKDTRTQPLRRLVTLSHPDTGLNLEVLSTEPAFQFYTGEHIDVPALESSTGENIPAKGPRAGIAVEPSRYVDAQRKEWRGQCLLKQGEVWGARSQYRAWKT
ncbi:hypothetical protein JMJ35_000070 [Cladonia borealis]|uniref:Aldose 1-epimerase n=1 Tax=Cladonia borealis TaxID=184061 RepID=A0AA39V9Y7_9LECA|nr:hypothetical protein JMJ35_000070 [Cladonia borealis]